MSYQALYRVWRPTKFVDLVGQTHITRTLQNALEQQTFSHAYLFSGPRGTGKTSAAKIFAQTVNCEQAPTREPCQTCAACRGIANETIGDVIEIDAASNTSVDDIREIRDKVKYATSTVPYKVYIIDEVHMISTSAFNALLKTLEEPPAHVIFILATTEPHKIPLTIISRCQRFDFKPIHQETIVERMKSIVDAEEIDVSKAALESIALIAEGGMRDALSILDQAVSYSENKVELEDVLAITGSVGQIKTIEMIEALQNQNSKKALQLLDDLLEFGKDPSRFVLDLIYFLRDMLLYKSNPQLEKLLDRAIVDDAFKEVCEQTSIDWIQRAISVFNKCQQDIRWTNNPKIYIEISMLSLTEKHTEQRTDESQSVTNEQINQLVEKITQLEQRLEQVQQTQPKASSTSPRQKRSQRTRSQSSRRGYDVPFDRIRHVLQQAEKRPLQQVQTQWATFLEQLKSANAPAEATMHDSKPVAASTDVLIVAFKYEIHCSLFLDHQDMAQSILLQVTGEQFTIIPIPEENWQQVRQDFIDNRESIESSQEVSEQAEDPFVEEARKLVGDELLNIHK